MVNRKVFKHPDKEEIIRLLSDGESVRKVAQILKERYPKHKRLWLTSVTLQAFRKGYLNLEGKVLKDIQETSSLQKKQLEQELIQKQIENTNAYKEKLNEIADSHLDVAKKILQLDKIIESRMEHYYNLAVSGELAVGKADRELRDFMDRQINLLAQYKKYVEGLADKTIDYNVNITVMNDQIQIIRSVIRDVLGEIDPEVAMLFIEKLNKKLSEFNYSSPQKTLPNITNVISEELDAELHQEDSGIVSES